MVINVGYIPFRLPPYHCILNPIELVWAQLKKIHYISNTILPKSWINFFKRARN